VGLIFRRTKRIGRHTTLNLSTRGASVSRRVGPLTVSSRGRVSLRLGRGWSWRLK